MQPLQCTHFPSRRRPNFLCYQHHPNTAVHTLLVLHSYARPSVTEAFQAATWQQGCLAAAAAIGELLTPRKCDPQNCVLQVWYQQTDTVCLLTVVCSALSIHQPQQTVEEVQSITSEHRLHQARAALSPCAQLMTA